MSPHPLYDLIFTTYPTLPLSVRCPVSRFGERNLPFAISLFRLRFGCRQNRFWSLANKVAVNLWIGRPLGCNDDDAAVAIEAKLLPQIFVTSRCQKSRPRCNPRFTNDHWGITSRRLSHGINSRFVGDSKKGESTSP